MVKCPRSDIGNFLCSLLCALCFRAYLVNCVSLNFIPRTFVLTPDAPISVIRDFMHRRLCQTSRHSSHWVESGDWPVLWKLCITSSICVLFSTLALTRRAPQTPCIKSPKLFISFIPALFDLFGDGFPTSLYEITLTRYLGRGFAFCHTS